MGKNMYAFLVVIGLLVGCSKTTEAPVAIKKANLRSEFKDNFKSAFENMAKETQSPSSQKLSAVFSKVMGLVGGDMGPMDPNLMKDAIEKIFDSELAKAIFADSNITSQSDTQIVYGIKPDICEKVAMLAESEKELIIKSCKLFLADHDLEFHVSKLADTTLNLELWHAKAGTADKKFVIGMSTSSTSLGARFDLSGAKDLIEGFMGLVPQDPVSATPLIALKKAKGAVSLQVRFKTETAASGCENGESLCFVANVDEDLDVEASGEANFSLKFGASPSHKPSVVLAAKDDGSFKGAFNLGTLDLKLNLGQPLSIFLEKSEFSVSMPTLGDADALEVLVENFKAGPNASFFDGMGKKIMLNLANDSRTIERIRFFMDKAKILADLSPFALFVSLGDSSNDQCLTYESLKLSTHKTEVTHMSFSGMPGFPSADKGYRGGCSEANLMVFPFWGMFHVSSANCDRPLSLAIKQGSLELNYAYHLNSGSEQSSTLLAEKDQCFQL